MPNDRIRQPPPAQDDLRQGLEALRGYVEYQAVTGIDGFVRSAADPPVPTTQHAAVASTFQPKPLFPVLAKDPDASPAPPPTGTSGLLAPDLPALRAELGDCERCKLWKGRTQIVFGVGNPQAALMFVGEGPGRDEDLQGEPFVGRAGQLLTEIITKGMKLRRSDVYIANVVKCRPPENRNPETDEIAACQPFLMRQVELVRPRVIVALGTFAAQTLLRLKTPISRLRGHWHDFHGIKLMPTLHPAYLLRNPSDKRLVWEDIKMVMRELGQLP